MKKIYLIKISQPIGTFYCGKIFSDDLKIIASPQKRDNTGGIQRRLRAERIKDISQYCEDPDATFPTPIIIAIDESNNLKKLENDIFEYDLDMNEKIHAEILDGQHRLYGIIDSKKNIELPIVIMFNLTEEEKAYIFSTINSNQQKVDKSLIYDLFELSRTRSPYKTCHELARLFNSNNSSPFYGRLKMLETRESENETLSQGTFVRYVLNLVTDNPQKDYIDLKSGKRIKYENASCPLRYYFLNNQDEVIYLILSNCFSAAKNVFREEWDNPKRYILTKTTGFGGIVKFLKSALPMIFKGSKDLTIAAFEKIFKNVKNDFSIQHIVLTSSFFPPGEMGEKKLAEYINNAFIKLLEHNEI